MEVKTGCAQSFFLSQQLKKSHCVCVVYGSYLVLDFNTPSTAQGHLGLGIQSIFTSRQVLLTVCSVIDGTHTVSSRCMSHRKCSTSTF